MSVIIILSLLSLAFGRLEILNTEYPFMADEYIITYHANTTEEQATRHWDLMDSVGVDEFIYKYNAGTHKGFAAKITDSRILEALKDDPLVFAIEVNGFAYANQEPCDASQHPSLSWGINRVSHLGWISNGINDEFFYRSNQIGAGVDIYIIDTGIQITHNEFRGRARWGVSLADGGSLDDRNGHGTHCAGTAAGLTYGIAKGANLVAVKVLSASGSGTWAAVVSGVDYLTTHGSAGRALGSMSLGGNGQQAALTAAIDAAVAKGIPVVVAAGNSAANACQFTPAGIASVISVGATATAGAEPDMYDARSSFSNWGNCVHIFAPGTNIASSWIGADDAARTISGTSMACPHVAGQVAVLLGANPNLTPAAVKETLQRTAQVDHITLPVTNPASPFSHS